MIKFLYFCIFQINPNCTRAFFTTTFCIVIIAHCFFWQITGTTDEADFPWGRFADDQVRQSVAVTVQPTKPQSLASSSALVSSDHLQVQSPLFRLNDFNAVNRNFTANRGAFGFRKPKKTKQDSKPAISKQSATARTKNFRGTTNGKQSKF